MIRYSLCFIGLLFMFQSLAQPLDLSQYQARFERRQLLEIRPSITYNSGYIDGFQSHTSEVNLTANWQNFSNTDEQINSNILMTEIRGGRNDQMQLFLPDNYFRNASTFFQKSQLNYRNSRTYWGWRASFNFDWNSNRFINTPIEHQLFSDLNLNLFHGNGRLEFVEDALLANWILADLQTAKVIDTATPEQTRILAQRITAIIGNRVFDFRRRRIFELEQLKEAIQTSGLAVNNQLQLFTILNDNWAFANRVTLPRGTRWQYGINLSNRNTLMWNRVPEVKAIFRGHNSGGVFLDYDRYKIIKNRGYLAWQGGVSANVFRMWRSIEGVLNTADYTMIAYLGVRRLILPSSRAQYTLSSRLSSLHTANSLDSTPLSTTLFWNNQLRYNLFLSYRWQMQIDLQVTTRYRLLDGDLRITPNLSIGSQIAIF